MATCSIASRTGRSRGSAIERSGVSGTCPVDAITKLSLVDVSPSTVAQLNETSAISRAIAVRMSAGIGASVARNESIVAMFGWIIPEPFAIPVTVIGTPSTIVRRDAPLGTVSVVMIDRAASNQPSLRAAACATGSAATIFSNGSGSMITPVENGRTSSGAQRSNSPTAAHVDRAALSPGWPVPAFALPALTISARSDPPVRC